jgi:hypothetical protein
MAAPMVPKYSYRLKDYRICQLANGRLWWEGHSGFGSQIGGPCYIWGDILVLGARCDEEIGFLISEFLDSLRKLPGWRKTRYYCFASALLDVNTGQVVNEDRLAQKMPPSGGPVTNAEDLFFREPGSFMLGRYQINITPDRTIIWKCSGGADRVIGGPAIVESHILFFGPGKTSDEKTTKKVFLSTLRLLPKWDRTRLWCRSLALKAVSKEERAALPLSVRESETFSHKVITSTGRRHWDSAKRLWSQMVYFYDASVDVVRTRRPQKGLANIIRKFKNKID